MKYFIVIFILLCIFPGCGDGSSDSANYCYYTSVDEDDLDTDCDEMQIEKLSFDDNFDITIDKYNYVYFPEPIGKVYSSSTRRDEYSLDDHIECDLNIRYDLDFNFWVWDRDTIEAKILLNNCVADFLNYPRLPDCTISFESTIYVTYADEAFYFSRCSSTDDWF